MGFAVPVLLTMLSYWSKLSSVLVVTYKKPLSSMVILLNSVGTFCIILAFCSSDRKKFITMSQKLPLVFSAPMNPWNWPSDEKDRTPMLLFWEIT